MREAIESQGFKDVVVGAAAGAMAGGILEVAAGPGASEVLPHVFLHSSDPANFIGAVHSTMHEMCNGVADAPVLAFMMGATIGAVQGGVVGAVYNLLGKARRNLVGRRV